jgi:hypothetical protein
MTTTLNASTAGAGGFIATSDNSGSLALQTAGTTAITVDTSQNVGIGTASPSGKLNVSDATSSQININSSANGATRQVLFSASSNTQEAQISANNSTGELKFESGRSGTSAYFQTFYTNNSERMRIDSSGNLLVGTTSGAQKLIVSQAAAGTVSGYFISSNATTAYGIQVTYTGRAPNGTGEEFIYCNDTSVARFVARSNGGLANYSANNVNLSDRREKTNFSPSKSYLDVICAIPVQTFNYIDQNMEEDGGLTLGVVAQDVQAVAPELVSESNWASKDEPEKMRLSIYQTDLQYALMKSIQELKAINDTQAATINALTARIVAIESRGTV